MASLPKGWIRLAWIFVIGGAIIGLTAAIILYDTTGRPWEAPLMACAALAWLFVAAWGPQAIAWSQERRYENEASEEAEGETDEASSTQKRLSKLQNIYKKKSHWFQAVLVLVGASGSIASWLLAWPKVHDQHILIWFGLVGLLSFPSLILSNVLASHPSKTCSRQARFMRFAMFSFLVIGIGTAVQSLSLPADIVVGDASISVWVMRLLAFMHILLASEWIIRAFLSPFLPKRSADRLNDSFLLVLIGGGQPDDSFGDRLQDQFGIDISQSWAVQFIRRSSMWLLMIFAIATWLLSAITTLRVEERGIYQRMGHVSKELMEPGLHVHLPWPFGSVRRLSYGKIEGVRLNAADNLFVADVITDIDAPSNRSNDRIWSKSHGEELFLMIANHPRLTSSDGDTYDSQRPYELYHADVVITYRIGFDPTSALQAVYYLDDPGSLIARIGRRELIELFNSRTAEDLLFADFSEFSKACHASVQASLDELHSGIDIVDVIFEAVHPPIKTAPTFHRVHGAEKESVALVDIERAKAEKEHATAQITASQVLDQAEADAFNTIALARAEQVAFLAERQAVKRQREVFTFERSLQVYEKTFTNKNLIIVDPDIRANQGFVVDLREHLHGQ
ncbi:MAG: hypothetical protein CSB34_05810 [Desulfobulbus propionicus]|nr:MAG: hypothetical protein CSB34_05810 [Desulfobulbus propionicus]